MTASTERRLAKVEAGLDSLGRVLVWLEEAHAYGGLSPYIDSLLDGPPDAFPINRLIREAVDTTRGSLRGVAPEAVDDAVQKALRATVFRFELVLRINVVSHEQIERETLLYALSAAQLALHAREDREERRTDEGHRGRLAVLRDAAFGRVDELLVAQEARAIVEQRYLGGRAALFPDDAQRWAVRLQQGQELAVMAERLAELGGVPFAEPGTDDLPPAAVAASVVDLVEPARVMALEKLDEGRRAFTIATTWLRSKAVSAPAVAGPSPQDLPTL